MRRRGSWILINVFRRSPTEKSRAKLVSPGVRSPTVIDVGRNQLSIASLARAEERKTASTGDKPDRRAAVGTEWGRLKQKRGREGDERG